MGYGRHKRKEKEHKEMEKWEENQGNAKKLR
jgi:hypothetical protein